MQQLFFLLILAACPLGMFFMMRGGRGHSMSNDSQPHNGHTIVDTTAHDARIAQLEREVTQLRQSTSAPAESANATLVGSGRIASPVATAENSHQSH